ncbi:hypothetical protein HF675_10870 [Serratia sp. JUb9]|nr:hypothetical protein [Serratia sp. JUb9]QNK34491.1 hypothetical protein HF675_10870 [Serratia sp. JUb9]QPT11607.1 hypothetical protein I6G37_13810 [Serratia rubidaea]
MTDDNRLNLLEKMAVLMFAVLLAYIVLTFGLSFFGLDHPWPCPKR